MARRSPQPADTWCGGCVMTSPDGGWAPAASRGRAAPALLTDAAAAGPEEGRAGNPIRRERGRGSWTWPEMGVPEPHRGQARVREDWREHRNQVWVRSPLCAALDLGPRPLGVGQGRGTRPISIPSSPNVCKAPTVWCCWGLHRTCLAEGHMGHPRGVF